jgi:thiol-disulfide isomerase/thioredoxin
MFKHLTAGRSDLLVVLLALAAGCNHSTSLSGPHGNLLPPGTPLPALVAEGWLNGPGPTTEELRGQVVVIDVWAYWCGPCLAAMPEMVAAFDKYKDQNVRFVGLTMEGADKLDDTSAVVKSAGLTWPNGYGAGETIGALGVNAIPSVFVIGKDGRVVWNNDRHGSLDDAIESALGKG